MRHILLTWIGQTDLRAPRDFEEVGLGPIAQAVGSRAFEAVFILSDYRKEEVEAYLRWLEPRTRAHLEILFEQLSSPTSFGEIYQAAIRACQRVTETKPSETKLTFHLSPGTPAMAAVWIIIGKTRYPAELIESSREHGVRTASVPFDISAELIPDLFRKADQNLSELARAAAPGSVRFGDIIYRSTAMARLIEKAQRAAVRSFPVLIEGESGTGKELLARAIHGASPRSGRPLRIVNCGAIPLELVEAEFFGHEKGAFTGATQARPGYFEDADNGTLFLDEIGELPLSAQVKLLRVLQDGEVTRVGATRPRKVDVRVIAATNRDLLAEVAVGRFREDLFFRLAVLVLKIPPLRDREGELGPLIDGLLERVNEGAKSEPGFHRKILSQTARNLFLQHQWPGNVRELLNTLQRAAVWSEGEVIGAEDVAEALLNFAGRRQRDEEILNRPLGKGLDIKEIIATVAGHYLQRAIEVAHGNKTRAAELVGLPNYQTMSNWMTKYGLK